MFCAYLIANGRNTYNIYFGRLSSCFNCKQIWIWHPTASIGSKYKLNEAGYFGLFFSKLFFKNDVSVNQKKQVR